MLFEWIHLILRWFHFTAGVAWIGASFYFNWLEGNLERDSETVHKDPKLFAGDLWAVHGGGFYHVIKYKSGPEVLPKYLHWFKWEAYTTWLSGISLLVLVYYSQPNLFLLDTQKDISQTAAISVGVFSIIVSWIFYDLLSRTRLLQTPKLFFTVMTGFLFCVGLILDSYLSQRGTYIHIGAILGTLMVGNVFRVIIPSQKILVNGYQTGLTEKELLISKKAGLRSLHNNYITLPVLLIMISSHFPHLYSNSHNILVLLGIGLSSVIVRHAFNLRNWRRNYKYLLPVACIVFVTTAIVTKPDEIVTSPVTKKISFSEVEMIFKQRCQTCHSRNATDSDFRIAPNGVVFDTEQDVLQKLELIKQRVVIQKNMPLGNKTQMTDSEREKISEWIVSSSRDL